MMLTIQHCQVMAVQAFWVRSLHWRRLCRSRVCVCSRSKRVALCANVVNVKVRVVQYGS